MFIWPVEGPVSRGFDYESNIYVGGMHAAIDIPAAIGVPFRAVADGVVVSVGWDFYSGLFVAVDHDDWRSIYRHLRDNIPVVQGQTVWSRQAVGYSGNTGYTTGPHLHFDLWNRSPHDPTAFYKNGWWAHDPELYLGQEDDMTPEEYRQILREELAPLKYGIGVVRGKVEKNQNTINEQASAVADVVRGEVRDISVGGGSTPGEIKEALKDAQREGTG